MSHLQVHKRNEAKMLRENGHGDSVFIEKECECNACGLTFNNRSEWVSHKIAHARTMKPSTTFEWNCEICGKIFTRKERLLVHIVVHSNDVDGVDPQSNTNDNTNDGESNSQSSMSSQQSRDSNKEQLSTEPAPTSNERVSLLKQPTVSLLKLSQQQQKQQEDNDGNNEDDSDDDAEDDDAEDAEDDDEDIESESNDESDDENDVSGKRCELCEQPTYFSNSDELRVHIKSHFMNEGGHTDTIKSKEPQQNESNDATDDDESHSGEDIQVEEDIESSGVDEDGEDGAVAEDHYDATAQIDDEQ